MEQVRSFIAIELPDAVKLGIAELQQSLKAGGLPGIKWVDPESIHLTLKFLGSIGVDKIDAVTAAMQKAAGGINPFRLEINGLGAFPSLRRVQVVWVGIGGEVDRLTELQRQVELSLAPLGFAPESRNFSPHLTLARLRSQKSVEERQRFGQIISGTSFTPDYRIEVESINLMKSQLTRYGAIYSQLGSVRL